MRETWELISCLFLDFFRSHLLVILQNRLKGRWHTAQDDMIRETIELINVAESKKIIFQEKVDIFVPSIVKSNTGIIIADAGTDLNRIYVEVSGRII